MWQENNAGDQTPYQDNCPPRQLPPGQLPHANPPPGTIAPQDNTPPRQLPPGQLPLKVKLPPPDNSPPP